MDTRQEHTTATKRSTHPLTAVQQNVVHAHEAIHPPPCITAVQQMTYQVYSSSRGRESGETTMGPENKSTKHVKHPEPKTHSKIHLLTHQPTRPNNPPTHQPTHPRYATAIQQSTAAAADALMMIQTESQCPKSNVKRQPLVGFPCIYDYPPPRGVRRPFPGRPPLAEPFIGARSFGRS